MPRDRFSFKKEKYLTLIPLIKAAVSHSNFIIYFASLILISANLYQGDISCHSCIIYSNSGNHTQPVRHKRRDASPPPPETILLRNTLYTRREANRARARITG